MELKPGYKQTEVGVIPEDWEIKKLGELARFRTGPFGSALHKEDYTNNGIPIVNPMHIVDGKIVATQEMTITAQRATELADFRLRQGDIVIGRRGEMGRCAVVKADQDGWLCGTGSMIIRTSTLASADFLQLVLSSRPIVAAIENASVGSTMINLNQDVLAGLKVAIPVSNEEQETISSSIEAVGAQVEALQTLIAKKQQIKQAAMQELLTGKRRLPGFEGEWEVKTLFDLANRKKEFFDDGDWIESEHITTEGIRLIQTGNIGIGDFVDKADKKFINERSFTSLRCKQLMHGDLLICRLADPAGRSCVLPVIAEERIVTSVDVTIFRPPAGLADRHYLNQVFSTPDWLRSVSDRSGGTTHKRISRNALGRLSINLPPLPEQTAIAEVLCEMNSELVALEAQKNKAQELKQGMMQQLLTGTIRLG